jgi:hypothetical protein
MKPASTQITLRIPDKALACAEALVKRLAPLAGTRADVLRTAIELGLEVLDAQASKFEAKKPKGAGEGAEARPYVSSKQGNPRHTP